MAFFCNLLITLVLIRTASARSVENLAVECYSDGTFNVLLSGNFWFRPGPVAVRANNTWWSTDEDTLEIINQSSNNNGSDAIGSFTSCEYTWKAVSNASTAVDLQVRTYINVYDDVPVATFAIAYITAANNTAIPGVYDRTVSSFPSFIIEENPARRGYATWAGNMAKDLKYGVWSPKTGVYGDIDGGFPLVVFDFSMDNTVVLSPMNSFMSANQISFTNDKTGEKVLTFGPISSINEVPEGYIFSTILVAGQNITGTMRRFGEVMRIFHQKDSSYRKTDFTINYLGYWTDNGACYYYNTSTYPNYEEALVAVKQNADKEGLPYKYLQLDSWWYYKGTDGGVKNWTAMPDVFPNGIQAVVNRTGWPIVAHNRWWSPQTDYAKQNGGKFDFIIDKAAALPIDSAFWDFLLSSSQQEWGLWVYEQDWLYVQYSRTTELLSELGLARTWMKQMGDSAQRYGLTIQYCMPWPRHVLQSLEIPVVTQIRVSDDYQPGNTQWRIGDTTILARAVGLAAFKDNFRTSTTQQFCHPYRSMMEPYPALETYVAALSGGPVGPSDQVGTENKTLIMATCMADGRLLKPTHPVMSVDSTFLQRAFGSGGASGQLWAAFSEVESMTWYYIFAAELTADYELSAKELPPSHSTFPQTNFPSSVAVQYTLDGTVTKTASFDTDTALRVSMCGEADFQYWVVAPVLKNGLVLFGELTKIVPTSETRFKNIINIDDTYLMLLDGVPGEIVTLTILDSNSLKTEQVKCTVGASGNAKLTMTSTGSSCTS